MKSHNTNFFNAKKMDSFRKGDEKVFAEIYNVYWKKLLGIAYRHLQDKSLAESVVQEVFISLWNRRADLMIDSLDAYLATATKYCTFKTIQKSIRHLEVEHNAAKSDFYMEDEEIDARFLKDYINGVVENLPEKCRLVFKLSRESYLSNQEISDTLAISEKTVEAHITRALKVLRSNLQKVGLSIVILFCL